MRITWMPAGLAAGLAAAAITGGAVMAQGGDEAGNGAPDGSETREEVIVRDTDTSIASIVNDDVDASAEPDDLSVRVAEILGIDTQAAHDAMVQADTAVEPNPDLSGEGNETDQDVDSMSVEAEGLSYLEYGNRIGVILGLDGERIAQAIAQAYEELYAIERDIRDTGSGRDAESKYESDKQSAEPAG